MRESTHLHYPLFIHAGKLAADGKNCTAEKDSLLYGVRQLSGMKLDTTQSSAFPPLQFNASVISVDYDRANETLLVATARPYRGYWVKMGLPSYTIVESFNISVNGSSVFDLTSVRRLVVC